VSTVGPGTLGEVPWRGRSPGEQRVAGGLNHRWMATDFRGEQGPEAGAFRLSQPRRTDLRAGTMVPRVTAFGQAARRVGDGNDRRAQGAERRNGSSEGTRL
jgi:hypothetical protein